MHPANDNEEDAQNDRIPLRLLLLAVALDKTLMRRGASNG